MNSSTTPVESKTTSQTTEKPEAASSQEVPTAKKDTSSLHAAATTRKAVKEKKAQHPVSYTQPIAPVRAITGLTQSLIAEGKRRGKQTESFEKQKYEIQKRYAEQYRQQIQSIQNPSEINQIAEQLAKGRDAQLSELAKVEAVTPLALAKPAGKHYGHSPNLMHDKVFHKYLANIDAQIKEVKSHDKEAKKQAKVTGVKFNP